MQITVPYVDLISFSSYKYYSYPDWVIQALPDEDSPKKKEGNNFGLQLLHASPAF